jgi:hypothetical protein
LSRDVHTKILVEGFRDKIFDAEIITALEHALSDKDSDIRISTIQIFTAAIVQGALHYLHRLFILTYLQRGFGTRYLILRLLLHLNMH